MGLSTSKQQQHMSAKTGKRMDISSLFKSLVIYFVYLGTPLPELEMFVFMSFLFFHIL